MIFSTQCENNSFHGIFSQSFQFFLEGFRVFLFDITYKFCYAIRNEVHMDAKLTLSIDSSVISSMKGYASENNSSISQIVESFFRNLLSSQSKNKKISPLVQELSGIIPVEKNDRNDYINYLEAKYE